MPAGVACSTAYWMHHRCHAASARDLLAWLGPAIGPERFEVGGEVRAAFVAHDAQPPAAFARMATNGWPTSTAWHGNDCRLPG
jgi:copper oxidase (laccase) domain-containing protein